MCSNSPKWQSDSSKPKTWKKRLSPKQLAICRYILEAGEAAPREISRETKIVKPTVIKALNRLMKLGKIERIGMGRGTRYRKL